MRKKGWEAYQKLIFLSEMVCLDFGHSKFGTYTMIQIVRAIPSSDYSKSQSARPDANVFDPMRRLLSK
jgi:hypothetical protein